MAKVLLKKGVKATARQKSKLGFDVNAVAVGTSKWLGSDGKAVTVYAQTGTNNDAGIMALARDILANRIDDIMAFCDDACQVKGGSGNVIIDSGSSGAYHYGCDFVSGGDWYEDDFGATGPTPNNNGGLTTGLVMAEVIESYMGLQNAGWNCGGSGGEALSRIFAETASGGIAGAMSGGFSARSSYDGSNWIDQDQGSDQDYPSIGCGMLYLDWVRSLGYSLQQITRAGGTTLAANYKMLTGKSTAWADFSAAVAKVNINDTNPFKITDTPYPLGNPPPPPNAIVLAQPEAAGTYSVTDAAGNTVATLTVTSPVAAGTYTITLSGAGTLMVTTNTAPGSYNAQGVGGLSVLTALMAGQVYNIGSVGLVGAFPPWLLALLKLACTFAPKVPPPLGPFLAILCALLPAEHSGKPVTDTEMLDLKAVLNAAYAKRGISPCG